MSGVRGCLYDVDVLWLVPWVCASLLFCHFCAQIPDLSTKVFLLCNRTTFNRTLDKRFHHPWFFPTLLWSCVFTQLQVYTNWYLTLTLGFLLWSSDKCIINDKTIHMCRPIYTTQSMETGGIGFSLQTNDVKWFSQLNTSGTMLVWTPIHNTPIRGHQSPDPPKRSLPRVPVSVLEVWSCREHLRRFWARRSLTSRKFTRRRRRRFLRS